MARHPGTFATLAVGLFFVGVGVYIWFHMGRFLDHARETTAVVMEVRKESATPNGRNHPVVQFKTEQGVDVVVHSDEHHNVKPADTVRIIYDPRNPQTIEITTLELAQRRRGMFAALTVALGVMVCVTGIRQTRVRPQP